MKKLSTWKRLLAVLAVFGLFVTLAACGDDDSDDAASDDAASDDAGADDEVGDDEATENPGAGGDINLGIIGSWTDGLSMAHLWKAVLEERGYNVEITDVADAAPLYTSIAGGDIDIYPSAWSETTHADYMAEYGDDLEDLGSYYENAVLTLAVPEYVDVDSIADLEGQADRFDGRIVGIEPGAGLTRTTEESVMPTYGLDDYTLVKSSTTAMLAELEAAIDKQEDIVVTLWRPFWANSTYPVKDLEDPEGALGEPEALHFIARLGFSDEFPEVAELMANAAMTDEQYGSLEDLVVNEYPEDPAEAIQVWLADNQDWVDGLDG